MSEGQSKFRHITVEQLKVMLDFMAQHPDFASGTLRTIEARHQSKQLWAELSKILNNHKGVKKTQDGWSRYWSDFKNKLKNKLLERNKKKSGSMKKDIRPLTKLEKQALTFLGPIFEKKHTKHNGFDDSLSDPLPIEIKQESMIESAMLTNGQCKVIGTDRMLGLETDNSSAETSDEECVEDGDQSSDEPQLNSIYSKWLMDIEEKRTDAELRRAKAEELRAEVSVKMAEAALVQAEALKKLSEAAEKQADAVLRIAMIMERRPDDLMMQARLTDY